MVQVHADPGEFHPFGQRQSALGRDAYRLAERPVPHVGGHAQAGPSGSLGELGRLGFRDAHANRARPALPCGKASGLVMIVPLIKTNRRTRTQVGSALERHAAGRDLQAIRETTARELAAASVSANTRRAYEGALHRLRNWLAGRSLDDATTKPAAAGLVTERVLAGFRREGQSRRGRGQVVGVRWEQAATAATVAGSRDGSVRGLRDTALLAVMSAGLLRVSETAALEVTDLEAEGAVQYIGAPTVSHGSGRGSRRPGSPPDRCSSDPTRPAGPTGGSAPCPSGPSFSDAPETGTLEERSETHLPYYYLYINTIRSTSSLTWCARSSGGSGGNSIVSVSRRMSRADRVHLARKRLVRVIGRHGITNARTLEQKISDAGPYNQRIDPHILGPARNALTAEGQITRLTEHDAPWYHLSGASPQTVQKRLAEQLSVFRDLHHGSRGKRIGQCLEIAIYRALRLQNTFEYLGSFNDLSEHDDSRIYSKEEPPQSLSGKHLSGKQRLDFLIRHPDAGWAGIEAKNTREWLYPNRDEIKKLIAKAIALDCVPVLIARRIPFVTFKVLSACGLVVHQNYNQLLPEADRQLAEKAKDKKLLGYHDIRVGNRPDNRMLKFIETTLPEILPQARDRFDEYQDILGDFADGTIQYKEFAARVRRRSQGMHENDDWEPQEDDDWSYLE